VEKTYLILDLRNHTYAPGLLTIKDGEVDWYAKPIFQVFKDVESNVRDSTSVVPLSFARRHKARRWSPVQLDPQSLETVDESQFEIIPSLFEISQAQLGKLLAPTLGPLLQSTFREYSGVSEGWMLVDSAEVRDLLDRTLQKHLRQKNVEIAMPSDWGALGGFALAFQELDAERLPREGETWLCDVDDTLKRYRWKDSRFTVERLDAIPLGNEAALPRWTSSEALERAGATLMVIFWQDELMRVVDQQIERLERQSTRDEHLLTRLRNAYERLSSENLVLDGQIA
jgi:hypothetical protein